MTLYYTFQVGYDDYDDFEYEIDAIEALEAIGVDIDDDIDIEEYAEEYRDEITDYYEDEAYEAWKDEKDYNANPLGYYGMSERDFI